MKHRLGRGRSAALCAGLSCLLGLACAPPATEEAVPAAAQAISRRGSLAYQPPEPGSYRLPPIQAAADGRVVDADGAQRSLFDYMGDRLVLLSPIYTSCSMVKGCPLAMAVFNRIEERLEKEPALAGRVRLITLSFDPKRDTPEVLLRRAGQDYLETPPQERTRVFLTTASWRELQPILDGYGQYVVREIDERGRFTGNFSHLLKVFLIDQQLQVRNIYGADFLHPEIALNDLKTLLIEEEAVGG